jgi:hypothetical protein
MSMDFITFNQILSLGACLIILAAVVVWMVKKPHKRGWAVPVLIFTVYSIIFYAILFIDGIKPETVNFWASVKSLLSYVTYAIYWVGRALWAELLNGSAEDDT